MKTRIISIVVVIGAFLLGNTRMQAQSVPDITIEMKEAGTLGKLLGDKKTVIEKLTLSGDINADDIRTIKVHMSNLTYLDMKEANIKKYGEDKENVVPNRAFYQGNCRRLKYIRLPESAVKIGDNAFENFYDYLDSLETVVIGDKVKEIGYRAFWGCHGLSSIAIPEGVELIEAWTFVNCRKLSSITIPESVREIRYEAFGYCESLESIVIPNGIEEIESDAFKKCEKLASILIPESVTYIGEGCFRGCSSLTEIKVDKNNTRYQSGGGFLYTIQRDTIVGYACGSERETIYIPNSVNVITKYAFDGAENIKNVYVNNTTPPTMEYDSFDSDVRNKGTLYVPKGSYTAYWLDSRWGDFKNIVETDNFPTSNEVSPYTDECKVQNISNGILISTNKPVSVSVYSINGQLMRKETVEGSKEMNFPKGIYIVLTDGETHKVIIK